MNATPHTVAGYTIVKSVFTGNPFSIVLGFILGVLSHITLDLVNESNGIRTTKERLLLDVLPTLVLGIFSFLIGGWVEFAFFLVGSIAGNFPDLIDKKLYLAILYPKKYKFTYYLHFKFKPPINPSGTFTRIIGWVLVTLFIIITLIF